VDGNPSDLQSGAVMSSRCVYGPTRRVQDDLTSPAGWWYRSWIVRAIESRLTRSRVSRSGSGRGGCCPFVSTWPRCYP